MAAASAKRPAPARAELPPPPNPPCGAAFSGQAAVQRACPACAAVDLLRGIARHAAEDHSTLLIGRGERAPGMAIHSSAHLSGLPFCREARMIGELFRWYGSTWK